MHFQWKFLYNIYQICYLFVLLWSVGKLGLVLMGGAMPSKCLIPFCWWVQLCSLFVSPEAQLQKTKIMASGPIISWQIDGKTTETVTDFIFLGSKITADGDCSHEIKRHLFLGRKAMTNLVSILKSRDITLLTKVCLVKAMVFPVVMYGCESWTIKKV